MTLRGALLGVGNAALHGHLPAYLEDPWLAREVRIVAAADESPASLAALAARLPGLRTYPSAAALLAEAEVDFVDVCTPPATHLALVQAAARHGRHVLCEKPVAASLAEAWAIRRCVLEQRVVFRPCHQYRYAPLWRSVIEQVAQGTLGEVRLARFEALRERADPGSPHGRPHWRRRRDEAGGGVLLDLGIHYLYLLRLLFGLPDSLSARVARLVHAPDEVEDTALLVLEWPGRLIEVCLSWAGGGRENRLRIVGSRATLHGDGSVLRREGGSPCHLDFGAAMTKAAYPGWYAALLREFVEAVRAGHCTRHAADEAVDTMLCAEAAYLSAARGHCVALAEVARSEPAFQPPETSA